MKDRKGSDELRQRLGIKSVCDMVRDGRLRWFGHVEQKCRDMTVVGNRGKGRGRKPLKECVMDDMRKMKLRREDAQDRDVWRSGILRNRPTRASAETRTLKR